MEMKPEQRFYQLVLPHLQGHISRVENSSGEGMPDVNVCHEAREVWLELKCYTDGGLVLLRKHQYAWGMRRARLGKGRVIVLAINQDGYVHGWQYPYFTALPYGTASKYVSIADLPLFEAHKSLLRNNLYNFLFPVL